MTLSIGFVLFPNVTQLDLTGPLQVLHRLPGAGVHIAAKTAAPVPSDCGLSLMPTTTFADCPPLDLLCVPGGFGIVGAIGDRETLRFVADRGRMARYATSVCTGAFILGAAGLLGGKRATTHWAYHDLLPLVGAIPVKARTVRDGGVVTGGGVTAGIDFAFALAAEIAGEETAKTLQLALEYDPAPPFDAGAPERAAPAALSRLVSRYEGPRAETRAALARALAS